jgi:hypothetical protein
MLFNLTASMSSRRFSVNDVSSSMELSANCLIRQGKLGSDDQN